MSREILVHTGARLHFGLLAVKPPHGRRFGGVGVMIDSPGYQLRFSLNPGHGERYKSNSSQKIHVCGTDNAAVDRVERFLNILCTGMSPSVSANLAELQVAVVEVIPSHRGLGSGTQLALAVAAGLREWVSGLEQATGDRPSLADSARLIGRGHRSAIGIHGFTQGGFLVEAGQQAGDTLSPLVMRVDVPKDWRWILVAPRHDQGLFGQPEIQAFQDLPSMPATTTAQLCRLLLMDWLPALQAGDFAATAGAMWEYGQLVGEYFAAAQGGVFAHTAMAELAAVLRRQGHHGIAQTSWGPTLAILTPDLPSAQDLARRIPAMMGSTPVDVQIAATLNSGARILSTYPAAVAD